MRSVEADAGIAEHAESEVVREEALEVANERSREREEAHEDDRHRQREDRRPLRRAGDEIAGSRHQAHAEQHRQRAEQDGERKPASRCVRQREQPPQRLDHADHPPGVEGHDTIGGVDELRAMGDEEHGAAAP